MKYVSFKINKENKYELIFLNKSPAIDDLEYKRIIHYSHELIRNKIDINVFSVILNNEFLFIKEMNGIVYFIISKDNPYKYIYSSIIAVDSNEIYLKEAKLSIMDINNIINDDSYYTLECVIEALIDNISKKDAIYLDINTNIIYLRLILALMPSEYLKYIDYNRMSRAKISFTADSTRANYFNFDDISKNSIIEPKRYAYTIVDNLKISLENAYKYKKSIDLLIDKKKIDIASICDLLNLIDGKLERINTLEKLSRAISNLDGMEYNAQYIATLIFTAIHKYKIDKNILIIYKFIYTNISSSHDYVIKEYFANLALFTNLKGKHNEAYLDEIEYNAPFNILDYLYYLKNNNLFAEALAESLNNINYGYLLLDLICRDLKLNKGVIVPNEELLYFIANAIKLNRITTLEVMLKRIERLNKRAPALLLNIALNRVDDEARLESIMPLDQVLRVLELMDVKYSMAFYKRIYSRVDSFKYLDLLILKDNINKDYYKKLYIELHKDPLGIEIINNRAQRELSINDNMDRAALDAFYNNYYLDKYSNDYGMFTLRVMSYLKKSNDINIAIDIYNSYYKPLDPGYKDVISATRLINEFITGFDVIFYEYDKYIDILDSMNLILSKNKIPASRPYSLLRIGSYLMDKPSTSIIKDIIAYDLFSNTKLNTLDIFTRLYLKPLINLYFSYLNEMGFYPSILKDFDKLFKSLCNTNSFNSEVLKYFKDDINLKGDLFYLLLICSNIKNSKYRRLISDILNNISSKALTKYFIDYLRYLNNLAIDIDYINHFKSFIKEYSINNFSIIYRILLKAKLK